MGNNTTSRKTSARRAATFLAALGMLVLSSGIALMVAATPADAAANQKVVVCKYVATPGGHLDHIVIVSDNTLPDAFDGQFPFEWTDAQGQSQIGSIAIRYAHKGEQAHNISPSECRQETPSTPVAGNVTFVDPSCTTVAGATPVPTEGVSYQLTSGSVAAGQQVVYTETALEGFVLTNGPTFTHTFGPAVDQNAPPCTTVAPPSVSPPTDVVVSPPTVHHSSVSAAVTPTVVHAGLAGVSAQDLRGEQGLALVVAGMVLLMGAGGLGLRSRTARI